MPAHNTSRMSWFKRDKPAIAPNAEQDRTVRAEGLWVKCEGCRQVVFRSDLEKNSNVCPKCGFHFRLDSKARLDLLFEEPYETFDQSLASTDPLSFVDSKSYRSRLAGMQQTTGLTDAIISARGRIGRHMVNVCAMELRFIGGSMGSVVGEVITRAVERSLANRQPLVIISASGGARMQEGLISLMQLAKVSAALMKLDTAAIPYISLMTDPTTGGVTASFAMLGDLNIAEPGALIGFAGPRVIEQTIRQKLPEGFQKSEFLLQHGFLDAVVPRTQLREYLSKAFDFMAG